VPTQSAQALPLVKAHFIGADQIVSNVVQVDDELHRTFSQAGAIEPPYDPEKLCRLFEGSNALRQNVDAYAVNIDGFGHHFEPVVDLDSDDADLLVRDGLMAEQQRDEPTAGTA